MQSSHNVMWLLIVVFFAVLLAMVFNAWRKHHEALGRKLRGLGGPGHQPFNAEKEKNRARAHLKGAALAVAIEEIDLKAQTESVASDTSAQYRKSQGDALKMMIAVGVVLVSGILYGLYRFLAGP